MKTSKQDEKVWKSLMRDLCEIFAIITVGVCLLLCIQFYDDKSDLAKKIRLISSIIAVLHCLYFLLKKPRTKEEMKKDDYYLFNNFTITKIMAIGLGIVLYIASLGSFVN